MNEAAPDARSLIAQLQTMWEGPAWHGATLKSALHGVDAATAEWRPAPGRPSIREQVLHLAYARHCIAGRIARAMGDAKQARARFPRPVPRPWWPTPTAEGAEGWEADLALLRETHVRLLSAVWEAPVATFAKHPGRHAHTLGEMVAGMALHDAHHVGQIQLLRRLREASDGSRRTVRRPRRAAAARG